MKTILVITSILRLIISPSFENNWVIIMNNKFRKFTPLNIIEPMGGIIKFDTYAIIPLTMFIDDNGTKIIEDSIPVSDAPPNHIITTGNVNITAVKDTEKRVIIFFKNLFGSLPYLLINDMINSSIYFENNIILITAKNDKMNPTSTERKGLIINITIPTINVIFK